MTIALGSSGAAATGTTSLSVAYPASIAAGDMLVLAVATKYPTNGPSTPVGWTLQGQGNGGHGIDGPDAGSTYATIYTKEATGSESGSLAVTTTGCTDAIGRIWRFTKTGGPWASANTTGANNTDQANLSVTAAADPGLAAGDLFFAVLAVNTDWADFTSHAFSATGVSAWGARTSSEDDNNAGDFASLAVTWAIVTTGTSSAAPVWTANLGPDLTHPDRGCGGVSFLRLREGASFSQSVGYGPTVTKRAFRDFDKESG